jgi:hypothetical protein
MVRPDLMLDLVQRRIVFYSDLSKGEDVFMEIFSVLKNPKMKGEYFIHLKYKLQDESDKKLLTIHEEIDIFSEDRGWICMVNQDKPKELEKFLKSSTIDKTINISSVQLK